ncbi:MAG: hypothetical protein IT200_03860 [Thermoleophilia bacterium]|nr:hypothetical protein [Thermoleophilia bacterium]
MTPEPRAPEPSPPPGSTLSSIARMVRGRIGDDRERRLVVRVAELGRRLELLEGEAEAARARARRAEAGLARVAAHVGRLDWLAAPGLEDLMVPEGGRTGLTGSGSASRVVCSAGTGPDRELLSVTGAAMAEYAYRWGWDVVLCGEDGHADPVVRKLRLVRELCDRYAWVLWLDPDASVVDTTADVLTETRPDRDLYVNAPVAGEPVAARAVMLVRAGDLSRRLLDHLAEHPDAEVGPPRHAVLDAGWAWAPGEPVDRGPFVMRGTAGGPGERRLAALDRLAALRRGMAAAPGALGDGPMVAFGPSTAVEVPDVLHVLGLTGTAVVVGTAPEGFCDRLAATWRGERVVHVGGGGGGAAGGRIEPFTGTAEAAAARFTEHPPDVVWLLGGGRELAFTQQLMTWWPLVRPGGLMLGHPYTGVPPSESADATAGSVDWFFGELGLPVHVTAADAPGATWMVRKPGD